MQQMQLSMGRTLKMPKNVSKLQNPKMGHGAWKTININGQRFGKLFILGFCGIIHFNSGGSHRYWLAQCDCGNYLVTSIAGLRKGETQSCGCSHKEHHYQKHGESTRTRMSPEYMAYHAAKGRALNPNAKNAHNYIGRGIEFRFTSFEEFLEHVGRKPTPQHSLERINNDGHYEIGNVRWATQTEQMRNQRTNIMLTINGQTQCAMDWSAISPVGVQVVYQRIRSGWCHECAVKNQARHKCPHIKI